MKKAEDNKISPLALEKLYPTAKKMEELRANEAKQILVRRAAFLKFFRAKLSLFSTCLFIFASLIITYIPQLWMVGFIIGGVGLSFLLSMLFMALLVAFYNYTSSIFSYLARPMYLFVFAYFILVLLLFVLSNMISFFIGSPSILLVVLGGLHYLGVFLFLKLIH